LVREVVESEEKRVGDLWAQRPAVLELEKRARDQWDVLRYLRGGRVEREAIFHERERVPEGVVRLGETLITHKGHATAVEVYRRVWEKNVSDPAALRRLMDICSMADDEPTAEAIRRRVLDEQLNPGNDTTPRQFALELAEILEKRGAVDEAVRIVSRAAEKAPGEFVLVQKRAQLLQRAGLEQEAEIAWSKVAKMPGGNVGAQNALAVMLEQRGKLADAIEVRVRGGGGNGDPLLPVLFYKDGRADDALTALAKLSANNAVYAAMTLAEAMGLNGDGKLARSVLVTTSKRVSEPRGRLQLSSKLLAIPDAPPSQEFVFRMQMRMREIAKEHPELAEGYFDFFERYAVRFGIETDWENEVVRSWADGKGALFAGVVALRRKLSQNDLPAARRVCEQLLARPDISGVMLERLDTLFAKQPELRLLVAETNARRGWPYAQATLNWVQRLDESGQREKARALMTKYSWLAAVAGGAELLGNEWLRLSVAEQARGFLQQAMRENDPVPSLSVLAGMARVHMAAKNFRAAKLFLQQTFSEPTCREYAALADYFDVAGEFSRWRESAKDFALSAAALHGLKQALFERFEKQGRLGDVLALLLSAPEVIEPAGSAGVTCVRVRALARKTGAFSEAAELLEKLVEWRVPDAEPDAAALYADWAEAGGKSALQHLERAVTLRPLRWEFVKRLAESHLAAKEPAKTRAVLKSFLWISNVPAERDAALEMWGKARGS
jgi:tetratricopeptide (TPR) repeat protein